MSVTSKRVKLAEAVKRAAEAYPYLIAPMEAGLVNYSALARKIKPQLDKQLGQNLSVEAIAMALHRNVQPVSLKARDQPDAVLDVVAGCKVHLLPDMVALHYPYNRKLQERLHQVKAQIEHDGGNLYNVERTNEISLVTQKQFQPQMQKAAEKIHPLDEYPDVALLTIQYPPRGMTQPGLLNYLVQSLTSANINLLGVFNSYSKISFILSEKDAPGAYRRIAQSIETAKLIKKP